MTVNGKRVTRPAFDVGEADRVAIDDPADGYVSRAALKLIAALDRFGYDPTGRAAIDLGASTGGFTQVLLERGAASVLAVDVGHEQLAPQLVADPRVRALEGVNARALNAAEARGPFAVLTSDVSFISQRLVLPPAMALCTDQAFAIVLAKPQFELGRAALSKDGVVRDRAAAEGAANDLASWIEAGGWRVDGVAPSPIDGSSGNAEFVIGARRG